MIKKVVLIVIFSSTFLFPQDASDLITSERIPLMVLASEEGNNPESIGAKVTRIVADQAIRLGRFTIIDRTNLEAILAEQALQMSGVVSDSDLVVFGEIAAAREALLVEVIAFGQKGVKPEEEKDEDREDRRTARKAGLFGVIVKTLVDAAVSESKKEKEEYEDNIQTTLQARVTRVDTQTGKANSSFLLSASHTGGTRSTSLVVVLNKISLLASSELKDMYRLFTEVLETGPRHVLLYLGDDLGVKPGTLFRVSSPRTKKTIRDKTVDVPGEPVAIVKSSRVTANANNADILRRWGPIQSGYEAEEIPQAIFSWGIRGTRGLELPQTGFQFQAYWKSFSRIGGGFSIGLGTVQDSRSDTDFVFNFGGDLYFRFINRPGLSMMGTLGIPANIVMRSDDRNNSAYSFVFAPRVGGRMDFMISPRRDLFIQVEYVLGSAQSPWSYTEGEGEDSKRFRAEWDGNIPNVKPQGLYLSLGIRFISFSILRDPQLLPGGHQFH